MSTHHNNPTAEFIVNPPSALNDYSWTWVVYLPEVPGPRWLAEGRGRDKEHATQCALKALHSVQNDPIRTDLMFI